jgi:hypothetical protein
MVSVIVPTMWKSSMFLKTVEQIKSMPEWELIIIDNDVLNRPEWDFTSHNIKLLPQSENIGVNPAWNLGVHESQFDWLLILNDDIAVNLKTIEINLKYNTIPKTLCGLGNEFHYTDLNRDYYELVLAQSLNYKPQGFGQLMILPKDCYYQIPNEMKIYMGDDILWQHQYNSGRLPYVFLNLKTIGETSATGKLISKWNETHPDTIFYSKWYGGAGFHWPFNWNY